MNAMLHPALLIFLLLSASSLPGQEEERADPAPAGIPLPDSGMVYVDGFYIDVYEYPNRKGAMPRVDVSWEEARDLCRRQGKRLCTGQEWRQACAGPENYLYGYGPLFESGRCNTPYLEKGIWKRDRGTAPSGAFPGCRSPYGAYDMIGNVWEWTSDLYAPTENWRVVRGGSWFHNVNLARTDTQYGRFLTPGYRLDLIGFRCCRSAPRERGTE